MMIKWTAAAISAMAISSTLQAQSTTMERQKMGLNVEALAGQRWGQIELSEAKSGQDKNEAFIRAQEIKLGANYQVMDLPLAFGLNLGLINYNNKNTYFGDNTKSAFEFDTSLEGKAWIPTAMMPIDALAPYVKLAYTPFSIYSQEYEQEVANAASRQIRGDNNGYSVGVGTHVNVIENISALVEYTYSQKTLNAEDKDSKKKAYDSLRVASHGVLVGVTAQM